MEQVVADLLVLGTAPGTGVEHLGQVHHQHGGGLHRQHIDQQGFVFRTGIGFCKQLPGAHLPQQVPVAPQVVVFDDDPSFQYHAYRVDHIPGVMDVGSLVVGADHTSQTVYPDLDLFRGNIFEQSRFGQKFRIHSFPPLF